MNIGIEAINLYSGVCYLDIFALFNARNLNIDRFDNLMMKTKSVSLPCEDPVTNGVNAAKPIIDQLTLAEKDRIEIVITASESGIDFGKSISTYVHYYLNLNKRCRLFELKQACYGGTAALQLAINYIASGVSPGAKVLIIATDIARAAAKGTYAEPSQGTGAVAILISEKPYILSLDFGANGFYSYEVMDTYRPQPNLEIGDPDLSLLSYLDCLENAYSHYCDNVEGVDFKDTFDYLVFHTPFPGMVKGAHKKMMRSYKKLTPAEVEADFQARVMPSIHYCAQVGNIYSATLYFALCSLIDHVDLMGAAAKRVGLFSYGSGCSSEFFSGIVSETSKKSLRKMAIFERLQERHNLSMAEYETISDLNMEWIFGIKDKTVDLSRYSGIYDSYIRGKKLLVLQRIENYHRKYDWS